MRKREKGKEKERGGKVGRKEREEVGREDGKGRERDGGCLQSVLCFYSNW